jgi:hypothetical protein
MRLPVALVALSSLLVVFAGCVGSGPALPPASSLSRHIELAFTMDSVQAMQGARTPMDALSKIATVRFDYVHEGAAVDPGEVTVAYTGASGADVERPLSDFTEEASLRDGEVVRIQPGQGGTPRADLFTPIRLTQGGDEIDARAGVDREWLTVQGYPIPLAFSDDGRLHWRMEASADMSAHVEDLRMSAPDCADSQPIPSASTDSCGSTDITIDSAEFSYGFELTGSLDARTSLGSQGPSLAFGGELHGTTEFSAAVEGSEDGEPKSMSAEGSFEADFEDLLLELQFDDDRDLREVTVGGRAFVDGRVTAEGDDISSPEFPSPILDRAFGPETEELPEARRAEEALVELLSAVWALDLQPGDEVAFRAELDGDDLGAEAPFETFRMEFVSQVLSAEVRSVAGRERATLKLSEALHVSFTPPGAEPSEFGYDYTYWIDAHSYLPVYLQGTVERTFDRDDIQSLLDWAETTAAQMGGDAPRLELPGDAGFTVRAESLLELDEASSDLAAAGILQMGAGRTVPMAAAVFVLVTRLEGSSTSEPDDSW